MFLQDVRAALAARKDVKDYELGIINAAFKSDPRAHQAMITALYEATT